MSEVGLAKGVTNDTSVRRFVVELRGITKYFPGVVALDHVDFNVERNEVVGLVGENGAGKSTLMKILIGLTQPDEGTIILRGREVILRDPATAVRYGVGMVFQEGSLVGNLSVLENLFLCHEYVFRRFGLLSGRDMRRTAREVLEPLKVTVDLETSVAEITPAVRQLVEVARLLWLSRLYHQDNPILILDEPTTMLTENERETLFAVLPRLKEEASVIFISHRLQEVIESSDRIVILKDGRNVTEMPRSSAQLSEIEHMMVGHTFSDDRYQEDKQGHVGTDEILKVENLRKGKAFEPLSFVIRKGEILSLVGLVGSGKESVCKCITGLERPDGGSICLNGKRIISGSSSNAVRSGVGHIPIDRRSDGLALDMTVAENLNLLVLDRLKFAGLMSPLRERRNAERWIRQSNIKTPSASTRCVALSGGNQQKTVISKWLTSGAKLLVLDHPTRGVDVGAKDEIFRIIRGLAAEGVSMLLMSDTLEEDIGLCDRMLIMKDGRLVKEVMCSPGKNPSPADIIGYMV